MNDTISQIKDILSPGWRYDLFDRWRIRGYGERVEGRWIVHHD